MKIQAQRGPFFLGAVAALMLTFSTAAVYPHLSQAADATPTPAAPSTDSIPAMPDDGKPTGRLGINGDRQALLAEALAISTEDLQAAYLEAANTAIDQAVEQDLLTQTQADNLRQRLESASANGYGFRLGGRGFFNSDTIDGQALLADALGISVEELQTAYADAESAALAQAVDNGQLTQEQADLMAARRAFQIYVRSQQQSYEELVQAAVDAGAITQAQADLLLENQQFFRGHGFGKGGDFAPGMNGGMMPGMGGHGMDGGRGMHGRQDWGRGQDGLRTQPDESSTQGNSNFVLPSAGL